MEQKIPNTHELYTAESNGTLEDARAAAIRYAQEMKIRPSIPKPEEIGAPKTVEISILEQLGDIHKNQELMNIVKSFNFITGSLEGPAFD